MANLYLPGDDTIAILLAQFLGYHWCRYGAGQVVGQRIVRFQATTEEIEEERSKFGSEAVMPASMLEPVEQLAFKPLPPFNLSRDAMAIVETRVYHIGWWELYLQQLRTVLGFTGATTPAQQWAMVTADARTRSKAAFLIIDAQRPKQPILG